MDYDAATESARKERKDLVSKHRSSLSVGNEPADAGWDSRTCLVRPNFQPRTGTRKISGPQALAIGSQYLDGAQSSERDEDILRTILSVFFAEILHYY